MPYDPHLPLLSKVNAIIKFVENPCNAPWTVYFETALPPAGNLIITLLSFGMDDVIRGFFKPKGLRSGRHGRKGKRGGKGKGGIPEIGEEIGKRLPGAEEAKGRKVTQGVKNLWLIDGALQRVLWYWLVVDASTEFFYHWSSLINESAYCRSQPQAALLAQNKDQFLVALVGWAPLLAPTIVYARGAVDYIAASVQVGPGHWSLHAACEVSLAGAFSQTYEIGVFKVTTGQPQVASSGEVALQGPGSAGAICTYEFEGPTTLLVRHRCGFGGLAIDTTDIFVMQARD